MKLKYSISLFLALAILPLFAGTRVHVPITGDLRQEIINLNAAQGGVITLDPGNYSLTTSGGILIEQPIRIVGAGSELTTITDDSSTGVFLDLKKSLTLENIQFDSFKTPVVWAQQESGSNPPSVNVEELNILGCGFLDMESFAITTDLGGRPIQSIANVQIRDSWFANGKTAVKLRTTRSLENVVIENNHVVNSEGGFYVGQNDPEIQNCQEYIRVSGNTLEDLNVSSGDMYGMLIIGNQVIISNNTLNDVSGSTVDVYGIYTKARRSSIRGNNVHGVEGTAIQVKGDPFDSDAMSTTCLLSQALVTNTDVYGYANIVSGNVVYGTGNNSTGIAANNDRVNIGNNYIENVKEGIKLHFAGNDNHIHDNRIVSFGESGIIVTQEFERLSIVNNQISSSIDELSAQPKGIYIAPSCESGSDPCPSSNLEVAGNTVMDIDRAALSIGLYFSPVSELKNVRVRDNVSTGADIAMGFYGPTATYDSFLVESNTLEPISGGTVVGNPSRLMNSTVRHNQGYVTENSGTATISGTSVNVAHGLSATPDISTIRVTPISQPAAGTTYWVNSVTSTHFTINLSTSNSALKLAWQVQ